MIVKKVWITSKEEKKPGRNYTTQVIRKWYGYFLFGFIPLYIVNNETTY